MTADITEAAQAAMERFDGDGLRLSFIIGRKSRWIAEMLPRADRIEDRLKANGWAEGEISEGLIGAYGLEPIARGEGATKLEAIRDLQPRSWRPDARSVIVKVIRPNWRPDAAETDRRFVVYVQGETASRSYPFDRRLARHCADSGKAYYHATVKRDSLEIGSRIMDQDW